MNCNDALEWIEIYVAGEGQDEKRAEVSSHLSGCPSCAKAAVASEDFINKLDCDLKEAKAVRNLQSRIIESLGNPLSQRPETGCSNHPVTKAQRRIIPIVIPFTAAAILILGISLVVILQPKHEIKVRVIQGNVQVVDNHIRTSANEQGKVQLPDETTVQLNEKSELKIESLVNGTVLQMTQGHAYFDVKKQEKTWSIKTPAADVSVLGTKFIMILEYIDSKGEKAMKNELGLIALLTVIVDSGSVEVKNNHGVVRLQASEKCVIQQDKAPEKEKPTETQDYKKALEEHLKICKKLEHMKENGHTLDSRVYKCTKCGVDYGRGSGCCMPFACKPCAEKFELCPYCGIELKEKVIEYCTKKCIVKDYCDSAHKCPVGKCKLCKADILACLGRFYCAKYCEKEKICGGCGLKLPSQDKDIQRLIEDLGSKDEKVQQNAAEEIKKLLSGTAQQLESTLYAIEKVRYELAVKQKMIRERNGFKCDKCGKEIKCTVCPSKIGHNCPTDSCEHADQFLAQLRFIERIYSGSPADVQQAWDKVAKERTKPQQDKDIKKLMENLVSKEKDVHTKASDELKKLAAEVNKQSSAIIDELAKLLKDTAQKKQATKCNNDDKILLPENGGCPWCTLQRRYERIEKLIAEIRAQKKNVNKEDKAIQELIEDLGFDDEQKVQKAEEELKKLSAGDAQHLEAVLEKLEKEILNLDEHSPSKTSCNKYGNVRCDKCIMVLCTTCPRQIFHKCPNRDHKTALKNVKNRIKKLADEIRAQQKKGNASDQDKRIQDLIEDLGSKNEKVVKKAADELKKLSAESSKQAATVLEALEKELTNFKCLCGMKVCTHRPYEIGEEYALNKRRKENAKKIADEIRAQQKKDDDKKMDQGRQVYVWRSCRCWS